MHAGSMLTYVIVSGVRKNVETVHYGMLPNSFALMTSLVSNVNLTVCSREFKETR
jgi:hypothetical protein